MSAASSGLHPWQVLGWLLLLLLVCATVTAAVSVALAWRCGGMRAFAFHLRRGLAMLASLCWWAMCAVADALWATVTLRGTRARIAQHGAAERELSLRGISRRDREAFTRAVRIIHGDLAKAAAQAEQDRTETEGP